MATHRDRWIAVGGGGRPVPLEIKLDWAGKATAIVGIATVLVLGWSLHQTNEANRAQERLTIQGQVSERFGSAIDQLGQEGDDKLSIRLGGIYALERLMRDSPANEPTIIEVLCAFVRTRASRPDPPVYPVPPSPPDVRAAIVVLARRPNPDQAENRRLDLTGALLGLPGVDLRGAHLTDADLRGVVLSGADLRGAVLSGANLTGAMLNDANLYGADLGGVVLSGADLRMAVLARADLRGANLAGAKLNRANLISANLGSTNLRDAKLNSASLNFANLRIANLGGAVLSGAVLAGADLREAYLGEADLRGVDLRGVRGLTSQQLAGTTMNLRTSLPKGVVQPSPSPFR